MNNIEEDVEKILNKYSFCHHHEGIILSENYFCDVAEDISNLIIKETNLMEGFKEVWLSCKAYLTRSEIELIMEQHKKIFDNFGVETIKWDYNK